MCPSDDISAAGRQPKTLDLAGAALDAAERAERAALAVHDAARAQLRDARSAYRAAARSAIIQSDLSLPIRDIDAEAVILAAVESLARARQQYDGLCALDESDRVVIDAAVEVEQARLDYETLRQAYTERRESVS
jgi:hypothetical protein